MPKKPVVKRNDPFDSDEFKSWVEDRRKRLIPKMRESASVLMIAPRTGADFDIEFALQIGAAILLEKPLILVVDRKRTVPPKLRAIADAIIEADLDGTPMNDADVQQQLHEVMTRLAKQ